MCRTAYFLDDRLPNDSSERAALAAAAADEVVGDTKLEFANEQGEIFIQQTPEDLLRAITEANS